MTRQVFQTLSVRVDASRGYSSQWTLRDCVIAFPARQPIEPGEDFSDFLTRSSTPVEIKGNVDWQQSVSQDDATKLALAVLDGDPQASLLLADEIQQRHLQGAEFISREKLLRDVYLLKSLCKRAVGELERITEGYIRDGMSDTLMDEKTGRMIRRIADIVEDAERLELA